MNFLNIRKGPRMEHIIGEHRNEFEKELIDIYMQSKEGFWGMIPSLEKTLLPEINPKFLLATFFSLSTGDPSHYIKETHGKLLPDYEQYWAFAYLKQLEVDYPVNFDVSLMGVVSDGQSVLDYHNVFYATQIGVELNSEKPVQVFKNVPIITIW